MGAQKTQPTLKVGALCGVSVVFIGLALSLAHCTSGTTPDCSEAGDMCGPDVDGGFDAAPPIDAPDVDTGIDAPVVVDAPPTG